MGSLAFNISMSYKEISNLRKVCCENTEKFKLQSRVFSNTFLWKISEAVFRELACQRWYKPFRVPVIGQMVFEFARSYIQKYIQQYNIHFTSNVYFVCQLNLCAWQCYNWHCTNRGLSRDGRAEVRPPWMNSPTRSASQYEPNSYFKQTDNILKLETSYQNKWQRQCQNRSDKS